MKSTRQNLNEAYQDRVQQIADEVAKQSEHSPIKKEDLVSSIESAARWNSITEYKLKDVRGSTAWKDFVKDVVAALKGRVKYSRPGVAASAAKRKADTDRILQKITHIIEDSISNSFPDGDPLDYIMPRVERLGIDTYDVHSWLDRAAKKYLHSKSYDDYMGSVYDDIIADNPAIVLQAGMTSNPFNGKPIHFGSIISNIIKTDSYMFMSLILDEQILKDPEVLAVIKENKEACIKSVLVVVKNSPDSFQLKKGVRNLIKAGIDWHELRVIQKGIDPKAIDEANMQPGDILAVETVSEAVVGTILYLDDNEIIIEGCSYAFNDDEVENNVAEGDVIYNKFGTKQAQKGKDQYRHNSEVADMIPQYNPVTRRNAPAGYFTGEEEPYDHFIVRKVNNNVADIVGVTKDGKEVVTSTTSALAADALVKAFNRGGFTDQDIERVPLTPDNLSEAKYQGREVKLGKPMAGDVRKFKVYVKDPKTGNIKKVNFGDPGMEIKRDDPERRKSFRARHGCGTPRASDRTKAAYWSCRMWSSKPVSKILKGK